MGLSSSRGWQARKRDVWLEGKPVADVTEAPGTGPASGAASWPPSYDPPEPIPEQGDKHPPI